MESQPLRPQSTSLPPLELQISDRLREYENVMLRRIFGPKREEVTGG
jgi:hypothetical protein